MEWTLFWTLIVQGIIAMIVYIIPVIIFLSLVIVCVKGFVNNIIKPRTNVVVEEEYFIDD